MITDLNKILVEWAYRTSDGKPDVKNSAKLLVLESVLNDFGWSREARAELLNTLMEVDIVRKKQPDGSMGSSYTVQKHNPEKGQVLVKKNASDGEIAKVTKTKVGKEKDDDWRKGGDTGKKSKELKSTLIDKDVSKSISPEERITNLKVKAEWELDGKEEQKKIASLSNLIEKIGKVDGSFQDRATTMVVLGHLYTARENSGVGKNMFGYNDVALLEKNKKTLIAGYDDAIPKEVEKYVRSVRKYKVSEEFVKDSFDTLPKSLQAALGRKGKVGDAGKGKHFLGYEKNDGTITSDVNDPDIKKDENGELVAIRGNTGNKSRALMIWRIYLEQGGVDAYTGEPLDLESMDLEHVVGFENKDKNNPPTDEEYLQREHEANQVLCSSRANQQKSDQSMKDFFKNNVDDLVGRDEQYFIDKRKGFDKANKVVTKSEQTALRLMNEVQYEKKGGGTTSDINDPDIKKTDLGTPSVADAVLGPNVTAESMKNEFEQEDKEFETIKNGLLEVADDPDDISTIKGMGSKLGKKTVMAMGLSRGTPDPSGRRSLSISGSDKYYRGFIMTMAGANPKDREKFKKAWTDGIAGASQDIVRKGKVSRDYMTSHLLRTGAISDEQLVTNGSAYGLAKNPTKTKGAPKYDSEGKVTNPVVIRYNGKEYSVKEYADVKMDEINKKLGIDS